MNAGLADEKKRIRSKNQEIEEMEEENEDGKPRLKPLQTVGTAAVMAAMAVAFFAVVFCIFAGLEWMVLWFAGGGFTLLFPLTATALLALGLLALLLSVGGDIDG